MTKQNYLVPESDVVEVFTEAMVCTSKTVKEMDYEELEW